MDQIQAAATAGENIIVQAQLPQPHVVDLTTINEDFRVNEIHYAVLRRRKEIRCSCSNICKRSKLTWVNRWEKPDG